MKTVPILLSTTLCLFIASSAFAGTISSTAAGGLWSDPSTWQGGFVPGQGDDVIVLGPVRIGSPAACAGLYVDTSGQVIADASPGARTLAVHGALVNDGLVSDDGNYWLELELYGDVQQGGAWSTHLITFAGDGDRWIADTSGYGLDSDIAATPGATGDITVKTPLSLAGFVDFGEYRVVLEPGSHLELPGTVLSGEIAAGGNELRFQNWSYLEDCSIDDAVITGAARVHFSVFFTTRVTVMGELENISGGGSATVEGDLINHGVIRNDQYSFLVRVHGDIENHGTIDTPQLALEGVGATHVLTSAPGAVLDAPVLLPEFQAATLVVATPTTFGGGLRIGIGTLVLDPGASVHFPNHGGVSGFDGVIQADGNTITTEGTNSSISEVTVDRGVLGDATLLGDLEFTGGLTVTGAVRSFTWGAADITVDGPLSVTGSLADGGHPLRITCLDDLENLGGMTNARVVLAGYADQYVGTGTGIAVPEFVIASGLTATGYQWYRDDVALAGETGPDLVLDTVGAADHGRYHCVGDGQASRDVHIAAELALTHAPDLVLASLEQNRPNPFNPATDISFTLERDGPVSLTVYDLAGRVVDRLASGEMEAGRHTIAWRPREAASGTYVYRLRAGGVELTRKCSLLK